MFIEVDVMKKELMESMKAQLAVNQQMIQETATSFKERVGIHVLLL